MVRFQQQQVYPLELRLHVGGNVSQISGIAHPHPFGPEDKAHRIGCVVGHGERADSYITDLEGLSGLEVFDRREPGRVF